mmetsp:Transcript_34847/g.64481  ORF Transcript_34847/g.64481 Transcript_34847/m.64481 type:complete len:199 (+) Transcript_34847:133-729(+)
MRASALTALAALSADQESHHSFLPLHHPSRNCNSLHKHHHPSLNNAAFRRMALIGRGGGSCGDAGGMQIGVSFGEMLAEKKGGQYHTIPTTTTAIGSSSSNPSVTVRGGGNKVASNKSINDNNNDNDDTAETFGVVRNVGMASRNPEREQRRVFERRSLSSKMVVVVGSSGDVSRYRGGMLRCHFRSVRFALCHLRVW